MDESSHPTRAVVASLGILVAPGLVRAEGLLPALREALGTEYPGTEWRLEVVEDALVDPLSDTTDLLTTARRDMLERGWDFAVVVTDLPVRVGSRPVATLSSRVHGVGVVSWPSLGPARQRVRIVEACLQLMAQLLGEAVSTSHVPNTPRSRQLREWLGSRLRLTPDPGDEEIATEWTSYARLLLGMIATNRPWRVALTLTRSVAAAMATVAFAVVTSDIWMLATHASIRRQVALGFVTIATGTVALIVQHDLWERAVGSPRARGQVRLFDLVTTITIIVGFTALYGALVLVAFVAGLLLVDSGALVAAIGRSDVDLVDDAVIAWFAGSLATLGGAVGAGLESESAIREAAYATRPTPVGGGGG